MAGKKRAAAGPAPPPSANRPDVAVASGPSAKRGRGRPKSTAPTSASAATASSPGSTAPNSAAAIERAAPKPGKSEKGAPKKKKEPQEEGGKRKKQQAAGGAEKATTPAKMMKKKGGGEAEPGSRKQKLSGEAAEKPAPTKKKQQASGGAGKATSPSKRKLGDAEQQKSAKKGPAGAEKPTPSKRKKKEDGEAEAKSGKKKGSPAKKAAAAAAAEPGSCSFPMARVRLLMRDEDASMRATNETVFLINKASELFLEAFAKDAYQNALKERKKSIAYDNLSTSVCNQKPYKFLSDFVPLRVTAGDALKATAVDKP